MAERVQRAYTLDEIDKLRGFARQYYRLYSNLDAPELEERIRTFMFNGTEPSEIARALAARRRAEWKGKPYV